MGSRSLRAPKRHLVGAAAIVAMWWVAFHADERIPLLTWVNLGIHELAHVVTGSMSDLANTMAGSIAQVAVPLLLAAYFVVLRSEWLGTGLCLAWAATSALEVATYVADAPVRKLELIGDRHDWAFILGPNGYEALDRAPALANTIEQWALLAILAGFAFCVAGALRGQLGSTASASAPTAPSTP